MASIGGNPFVLQNVLLTIAGSNYEANVSSVKFTPSSSTVQWKGLTPTSIHTAPAGYSTWEVEIEGFQDLATSNSLSLYTMIHENETQTLVFHGAATGQSGLSAACIITPGNVGGAQGDYATATFTFPVDGRPTLVA